MKVKSLVTIFILLFFAAVPIMADEGGAKDTVEMVITVQPDSANGLLDVKLQLWVFDDADTLNGVSMGFGWDNPKMQMTKATATSVMTTGFTTPVFYDANSIDTTNERQRFQCIGIRLFTPGVWPNPVRQHWATFEFEILNWTTSDVINVDTFAYSSGSKYKFVSSTGGNFYPHWVGGIMITDVNPSLPKNIVLSEDTLTFSAIQGGSTPPLQTFTVSSDADNFDFTLYDDASWLLKNPASGTTPTTVQVSISLIGLTPGSYFDSIRVDAPSADNTPQFVYVDLTVEPPPPTIGYSPSAFFFNAIAGEANPASQNLAISNTGGSDLNWSVTNSETWLDLNPSSGTNTGNVTVSADITGLPYGEYYDTIVVEDPNATNHPVLIPVYLSVASDLPTIEVIPANNIMIFIELSKLMEKDDYLNVDPRTITVRNSSIGIMNFWIEENAPRIDSVLPESGTAPLDVEVRFKVPDTITYGDYFDTLWVYSNEAINSPYPVIFQFHVVFEAAVISAPDTLKINLFECIKGSLVTVPNGKLTVGNEGGDDPMVANVSYESDYFDIPVTEGTTPFVFLLQPKVFDLPQGSYYDTVVVSAWNAINSPDTVIILYNVIPGTVDPEIYIFDNYPYKIPLKIGSSPFVENKFVIMNRYGGCMEWELQGQVPWATPSVTSGHNPGNVNFLIDISEYGFGSYYDTVVVISPLATNSPFLVEMLLQVWLTRGDVNFDGIIDITDIVYLIQYMYMNGAPIQPDIIVADVNCDTLYDVVDITYLIQYLYQGGPLPCD